jgi:hypothetical protein
VPQEARLGCRLQEPSGGFAGTLAQRRLTKRSRERRARELRGLFRVRKVAFSPGYLPYLRRVSGRENTVEVCHGQASLSHLSGRFRRSQPHVRPASISRQRVS